MRSTRWLLRILLLAAALALPLVFASDSFAESGCHRNGPPSGGGHAGAPG